MAQILLVDDDEGVRGFVARALAFDKHHVTTAADGAEGLESIEKAETAFDLVVSDIKMPVMDGIAMALEIARSSPHLPILLMTGYADQRERATNLEAIIKDVILKPFSLSDIRARVQEILNEQTESDMK